MLKDNLIPNSLKPNNIYTCLLYKVNYIKRVILIEPIK